jgi:FkbM family methyltransferase
MEGLKFLARSRSVRLLADRGRAYRPGVLHHYRWRGLDIAYRPGTSDVVLIDDILLRGNNGAEYAVPAGWNGAAGAVRVVLDIGANIGISTLYLASVFPDARVFAFEPVPENFELLRRNTRPVDRITAVEAALGAADCPLPIYSSDDPGNLGGFSLHEAGTDRTSSRAIDVRNAQREMERLGVAGAEVIKIDTEGSEWEILTSFSPSFLASTQLILGELHGRRDFALLDVLAEGFDIGVRKEVGSRRSNFCALRRGASST